MCRFLAFALVLMAGCDSVPEHTGEITCELVTAKISALLSETALVLKERHSFGKGFSKIERCIYTNQAEQPAVTILVRRTSTNLVPEARASYIQAMQQQFGIDYRLESWGEAIWDPKKKQLIVFGAKALAILQPQGRSVIVPDQAELLREIAGQLGPQRSPRL